MSGDGFGPNIEAPASPEKKPNSASSLVKVRFVTAGELKMQRFFGAARHDWCRKARRSMLRAIGVMRLVFNINDKGECLHR